MMFLSACVTLFGFCFELCLDSAQMLLYDYNFICPLEICTTAWQICAKTTLSHTVLLLSFWWWLS